MNLTEHGVRLLRDGVDSFLPVPNGSNRTLNSGLSSVLQTRQLQLPRPIHSLAPVKGAIHEHPGLVSMLCLLSNEIFEKPIAGDSEATTRRSADRFSQRYERMTVLGDALVGPTSRRATT